MHCRFLTFLSLVAVTALTGCGGSDGGRQSADPVIQDYPIAYVARPLPRNDNEQLLQLDIRRPESFNPGARLVIRDRASPSTRDRVITDRVFPADELYDVKDVEASHDGEKFVFAMRAPEIENAAPEDQPTWNIWEYVIASDTLRRIIPSDNVAADGQDVAPHYLPDGRIIFSSTRQERSRALLLDEGKTQFATQNEDIGSPAFLLHVMESDGSDLRQVSFNQSHDLDPTVLRSGRVLFTRWDAAGQRSAMHFYTMRPDGTDVSIHYGWHSHGSGSDGSTVQFTDSREMLTGELLTLIRPFRTDRYGGNIVFADAARFTDEFQQIGIGTVVSGAQSPAANAEVRSDDEISTGGRYSSAYPLHDGTGRLLVSWSPCRLDANGIIVPCTTESLQDPDAVEADPLYGIWIHDASKGTQLPVVLPVEGTVFTDIVAAFPRARPTVIADAEPGLGLDDTLFNEGVGVLHIRSVYDVDGVDTANPGIAELADPAQTLAAARPARFLRIVKAVSIPDDDTHDFANSAYGPSINQRMREIVGYAPIEPDGSVKVKVPADVSVAFSVLDVNGRRIGGRHQHWIQLRPGETRECNGCHTANSEVVHGRSGAEFPSVNPGSQQTGQPFPNTVSRLWTDAGETMAETRTRHSEDPACLTDCTALIPSRDLIYSDVWTDPAVRSPDADLQLRYVDLDTALPDTNCSPAWSARCRIVINYETHIHPLWSLVRPNPADTCTACHINVDVAAANAPRIPDAQLDLSDNGPNDTGPRFKSYLELFFGDVEQTLDGMGELVDVFQDSLEKSR